MRIFENTNYDFVGYRKYAFWFSGIILTIGLLSVLVRGLSTGIDFRGGTELVIEVAQPVTTEAMRRALTPVLDDAPEVKEFGGPTQILVRTVTSGDPTALQQRMLRAVNSTFEGAEARILTGPDVVSPRFADDLRRGAILSIIGGLLVIFAYVALRFEWAYAVGAVAALAHDVLFTIGMFSLLDGVVPFSLQVDQTIVAAFLTIVGYSINDTVIVFDRMREFTALFKSEPFARVVNRSINSTLARTLITSGSTLLTTLVLFLFGGEVIRPFAFALFVGVGIGTYSSIFVAAPIVLLLREWAAGRRRPARAPVAARA